MKKHLITLLVIISSLTALGGVGVPMERLALPAVQDGSYLICIWDNDAGNWLKGFETYSRTGSYDFQVPAWNKWYWIGLWDQDSGEYVYGKWVGHFLTSQ